jgi:hypothetical protein
MYASTGPLAPSCGACHISQAAAEIGVAAWMPMVLAAVPCASWDSIDWLNVLARNNGPRLVGQSQAMATAAKYAPPAPGLYPVAAAAAPAAWK